MKTGIIIPCYNEATNIDIRVFVKFIQTNKAYHLCFVNNGSRDYTESVLKAIKVQAPTRVSIVDVENHAGKASAVRSGARYLFNRQNVDFIGVIDANLSTNFEAFKALTQTIYKNENLSLVCGSVEKDKRNIRPKSVGVIFSKIIKKTVCIFHRLPVKDTQSGAKIFRRNIIPVVYNKMFLTERLFDVEILLRLKKHFGSKDVINRIHEEQFKKEGVMSIPLN